MRPTDAAEDDLTPAPSLSKFLRSVGIDAEKNLATACADFYLLERLSTTFDGRNSDRHTDRLVRLEKDLSREFGVYLDMVVGGELRHAVVQEDDEGRQTVYWPHELDLYLDAVRKKCLFDDRQTAWMLWMHLRQKTGQPSVEWLRMAQDVFNDPGWTNRHVGGGPWAYVAGYEYKWLKGRLVPRTFVDMCFTIQHNGGAIFDKVYSVYFLDSALETQCSNDYDTLSEYASPDVRSLWLQERRRERDDYDSAWLGMQEV